MMKKLTYLIIPAAILIVFLTLQGRGDNEYKKEIADFRADREDFFETSSASPFLEEEIPIGTFDYFKVSSSYKVNGKIERFTERKVLTLGNSDGTKTNFLRFGMVRFKVRDTEQTLVILKALGFGNNYLLAFGDLTSGESTYGGGRYIDVQIGKSDQLIIDFNKAYNPYCAYIPDYTCPLPPRENFMNVAIEAGEKDYIQN